MQWTFEGNASRARDTTAQNPTARELTISELRKDQIVFVSTEPNDDRKTPISPVADGSATMTFARSPPVRGHSLLCRGHARNAPTSSFVNLPCEKREHTSYQDGVLWCKEGVVAVFEITTD